MIRHVAIALLFAVSGRAQNAPTTDGSRADVSRMDQVVQSYVADKTFMGREIRYCAVLPKDGDKNFYTMVYQDKASGKAFAKRFQIGGVTRDKL